MTPEILLTITVGASFVAVLCVAMALARYVDNKLAARALRKAMTP